MKKSEFIEVFSKLNSYFKANLTDSDLEIYYWGLKDLSLDDFRRLCALCVKKFKFMPKIAEMCELIEGKDEDKAVIALEQLIYALNRYGTDRSVHFSDKAIMCVVDVSGGWEAIGKLEGKDWDNFKKFEFPKLYKTYVKLPHRAPPYLVGRSEKQNGFSNQSGKFDKVYFIGEDKEPMNAIEFRQEQAARITNKSPLSGMLSGLNKAAV